jgi:ribonuclease Z
VERLELAGIEIEAHSVGGIETAIHLPRWRVALDVGRCPAELVARDRILFTHGHMDHMGGVAYHCATRALRGMGPPTYYVPRSYARALERLLEVWRTIDHSEMPHRTVAVEAGEEVALRPDLVAKPFRSFHTTPVLGYAVCSRREKLRGRYLGLPGDELRALRAAGEDLTETLDVPELAYCGDTTVEVVEREELVRRARVLVLEATFVDERVSVADTRAKGHVHLDELAERADLFENEAILLHHFSARYRASEILAALDARLPAALRERVVPLLGAHRPA